MRKSFKIPKEVSRITTALERAGFEAYLVGGCVRDLLRGEIPNDWDITTNAKPEEIINLFDKTVYENSFGTVAVVYEEEVSHETVKVIEVTPYRIETKYSDSRHPDSVTFSETLEEDLKRRDFTVNAIAYSVSKGQIVDLYKGREDIASGIIRAVGNPEDRFQEDALRMLRAVRFSAQLGYEIEENTKKALKGNAQLLNKISVERIYDEFEKIIMSKEPKKGLLIAEETNLLEIFLPELREGIDVKQNQAHKFNVWEHSLNAVQHGAKREWPLHIRLASLFHDIGKPKTRDWSEEKKDYTFYGHEVVGARMTKKILERFRSSKKLRDTVTKLVRHHMFFSDPEQITLSAVRRLVRNVGPENVWDLMKVRACDRIGMGKPKEMPYRLRKYKSMIEEAMRAPVSVGMLKIDGDIIMKELKEKAGPRIGWILHALLEEVLDDPELNTKEYMMKRAKELSELADDKLQKLGEVGKEKREETETEEIAQIRKKHWVK